MAETKSIKNIHFWLRAETKPGERRTPLVPLHAKELIKAGIKITVEKSPTRCVPDEEYEKIGCEMAEFGTWPTAPSSCYILGLKELPESTTPLTHTHIFFAHCYKNQSGWRDVLKRFHDGKGKLLDLEFLVDDNGRRVAAFGKSAGFVGMALGLKQWALQQTDPKKELKNLHYYEDRDALVKEIRGELDAANKITKRDPKIMVMGALGRCGSGAIDFATRAGIKDIMKWDMAETKSGGPFEQILGADVFVNCIYLSTPIPPFINRDLLKRQRELSVVVDVSADTSNPHNPIPVYSKSTTFFEPFENVIERNDSTHTLPFDVCSIDHLPSLVPLESSVEFSEQIHQHLMHCENTSVWTRAEKLYEDKLKLALTN